MNLLSTGGGLLSRSSAILSSILFQGGSEILSNGREILQVGGRFLKVADNLVDDVLGSFGGPNGRNLAFAGDGIGNGRLPSNEVKKGGDSFFASTGETSPGDIPGRTNNINGNVSPGSIRLDENFGSINPIPQGVVREVEFDEAFDLVKAALDFRRLNQTPKNRNIAVFEFLNRKTGKLEIEAFENIPQVRKGRKIIRHGMHAEQVGAAKLRERHIRFKDVTRIFSEFEPCIGGTNDCANLIKRTFPNTQVFFAFQFNNGFNDLTRPRKISALKRFGALFD